MYFDTIHDLEKFDDVGHPEDGYTSYWETDTEVDEELGNFLFDNVAGDSASVICIDEAMDLIAMREQRDQRESSLQVDHYTLPHNPHHFGEIHHSVQPHAHDEHMTERSNENKRSAASRHSRRSHNSGSDGAYDEPPPVPPPRRQISSPPALSPEEHTYETLDDCQEEYAIYIAKGSDGSRGSGGSADSTAKPVSTDECDDRFKAAIGSSKSPVQTYTKPRSLSTPQPLEGIHIRHRRKLSEPVSTEYSSSRKRRSEKVCPKSSYPPPVRGYQLPQGIPEDYADYMAIPATTSPDRRSPHHYTSVPPTSPTRRGLSTDRLARVENRKSSSSGNGKTSRPPSLFIRHKGKTYFVPVLDKKLQQKLEKVKGPPQTYSHLVQRHNTINTSISRSSSGISTGVYQTPSLAHHSMRSHASPPKVDPCEQATSHKRKNSKTSQLQNGTPKHVTHYGVL